MQGDARYMLASQNTVVAQRPMGLTFADQRDSFHGLENLDRVNTFLPSICRFACAGLVIAGCLTHVARGQDPQIGFSEPEVTVDVVAEDPSAGTRDVWSTNPVAYDAWITVRAGVLTLYRSTNQDVSILSLQSTGETVLSTSEVDLGWGVGPELDFLFQLTPEWAFEFDWFDIDNWSKSRSLDLNWAWVDPINVPLTSAYLEAGSKLHNFEFNLRRRLNERWTLLAGFRYVELNETMRQHYENSFFPIITQDGQITARNFLYGFQLGADAALWQNGPFALGGWVKAGIYANAARSNADTAYVNLPLILPSLAAQETGTACVGDLGLRATWQIDQRWQIYGGYRLMLIDGVALAIDQFGAADVFFNGGPADIVTSGTPFYHGGELGLTFAF